MRSVFSIEPEGMTRAWPIVPLMRRNTKPTQNQAMISPLNLGFHRYVRFFFFFLFSDFMFHHHRPLCGRGFTTIALNSLAGFAVGGVFAHLKLH